MLAEAASYSKMCPSQGTLCLDGKRKEKSLSDTCALCGSGHLPVQEHTRRQLRTTRTLGTFASVFSALRLEGHIPNWLRRGLGVIGTTTDGRCLLSFESGL